MKNNRISKRSPVFWLTLTYTGEPFMGHVPILKAYEMTFPTNLFSLKSINVLQSYRLNKLDRSIFDEITKEIHLLQFIKSVTLRIA